MRVPHTVTQNPNAAPSASSEAREGSPNRDRETSIKLRQEVLGCNAVINASPRPCRLPAFDQQTPFALPTHKRDASLTFESPPEARRARRIDELGEPKGVNHLSSVTMRCGGESNIELESRSNLGAAKNYPEESDDGEPDDLDPSNDHIEGQPHDSEPRSDVETTSDYEEDAESIVTCALDHPVRDFPRLANGRTCHNYKGATYFGYNDEFAQDLEDCLHELHLRVMGRKLYHAPLGKCVAQAWDIGCGTGLWTNQFGDQHSECVVIGVDISPVQPLWVAPSVTFLAEDIELPSTWKNDSIQYIHCRDGIVPLSSRPKVFELAIKHLSSGGWLEVVHIEPHLLWTSDPCPKILEWSGFVVEAAETIGYNFEDPRVRMEAAGFIQVQQTFYDFPLNTKHDKWKSNKDDKEFAAFSYRSLASLTALQNSSFRLLHEVLDWSKSKVDDFLDEVAHSMSLDHQAIFRAVRTIAQKP